MSPQSNVVNVEKRIRPTNCTCHIVKEGLTLSQAAVEVLTVESIIYQDYVTKADILKRDNSKWKIVW